jgi:anti-anti-sigma factor
MQQFMQWHRVGQVIVVRAQGKDLVREDTRDVLCQVIAENPACDMVLNCESVDNISSSSLGAVFAVCSDLKRAGRQLILASVQPSLLDVLQMVGTHRLFTVVPDEETAMELLAGAKAQSSTTGEKG